MGNKILSVDEILNLVDYDFKGFMPTEYALMFVNFIKEVNGGSEENETPLIHLVMMDRVFNKDKRCAIMVFRGAGKCLDIYSRIASPIGDILLRDVKVGDIIYDRNLKPTEVTYCSEIYNDKKCYEIELTDNTKFICSDDHKHFVKRILTNNEEILTTKELFFRRYIEYSIPTINGRYLSIVDIREVPSIPTRCISVSSNTQSYIFNDSYITHNTSLFSEYLILFIASFGYLPGFGKVNLMMYVSDSIENGVKNLRRNVEFRYQNSDFLKKLIPNRNITFGTDDSSFVDYETYEKQIVAGRKFTDIRLEFGNNKGHRLVVRGFGASTGVRGVKEMGKRPNLCILDDLLTDEDAKSPTIIENIENTVYKAVSKALHPTNQKIIWLGTPFNANDPLYKAVESGVWNSSVFPICERFPVSKEEFKGAWTDRFNYEYVKREYDEAIAVGRPDNFFQELMLRISNADERLVSESDLIYFNRSLVYKNRDKFNFYITTDFATSVKKTADYSVILVWAYTNNGEWLLIDGICEKQLMNENIKQLFRYVSMYHPLGVGIEVSGQQGAFIDWLKEEMIRQNVYFNISSAKDKPDVKGIRPLADKYSRFLLFLPIIKQKKMWIANELKGTKLGNELEDEIRKATKKGFKSRHDDVLDAVSMLGIIESYKPSEVIVTEEEGGMFVDNSLEDISNTIF